MIQQFVVLGVYKTTNESDTVYDVIVDGEVIQTRKKLGTALLDLAEQIDKKIGVIK